MQLFFSIFVFCPQYDFYFFFCIFFLMFSLSCLFLVNDLFLLSLFCGNKFFLKISILSFRAILPSISSVNDMIFFFLFQILASYHFYIYFFFHVYLLSMICFSILCFGDFLFQFPSKVLVYFSLVSSFSISSVNYKSFSSNSPFLFLSPPLCLSLVLIFLSFLCFVDIFFFFQFLAHFSHVSSSFYLFCFFF